MKAWLTHPTHEAMPRHALIQRAIRQLILDGALRPGKPLPASRALAASLGVSRDTIESAYTQLHAEGLSSDVSVAAALSLRSSSLAPHSADLGAMLCRAIKLRA